MNYVKLPYMDNPVSVFAICQAHKQLEADYNVEGILRERPSNQRRNESTGCQLARLGYHSGFWWADIENPDDSDDQDTEDARDIYILNVLKCGLPISAELGKFIEFRYAEEFLNKNFPDWKTRVQGA